MLPPGRLGWRDARRDRRPSAEPLVDARPPTLRTGAAARRRRRRRPRRRPPADRHGPRASTATGWSRSATPGSAPSSGCSPGSTLLALAAVRPRPAAGPPTPSAGAAAPAPTSVALLGPLDHTRRRRGCATWSTLRDRGLREPLPLPLKTSLAYAGRDGRAPTRRRRAARGRAATGRRRQVPRRGRRRRRTCRVWGRRDASTPGARRRRGAGRGARRRADRFGALAWRVWEPAARRRAGRAGDEQSRDRLEPFDIRGPLPTGTTLLEASAGTGKTLTIAALVTRYVAEGVATLDEMLVVTFGRAASQELRERVRAQLVEAERALRRPGAAPRRRRPADRAAARRRRRRASPRRRRRLRDALAGFDAATIATTHQFCQMVLDGRSGVAGDTDAGATLVEDLDDLVIEVVDDLYLRAFAGAERRPAVRPRRRRWRSPATAVDDPQARLEPAGERPAPRRPAPGRLRAARCAPRWTGASAGSASSATTTCSAGSPTRSSRRRTPPARRADAAALADRAGRRVPGHRPGAVAGPRPRLQRPRHDGADRRPQAGDLRLPRRRRRHLPRRPPRPPTTQQTPRHQLAQRRGRWSSALQALLRRRRRSATSGSSCAPSTAAPPGSAGWSARRRRAPFRLRVVRRDGFGARPARQTVPIGRAREHIAARPRRRHRARCSPPARPSTARPLRPATSP